MDDLPLVERLVRALSSSLSVPVTVKIRRFTSVQRTVEYAQMLERAGASLLAIHGRTREQKRASEVLAEWEYIRAVKQVGSGGAGVRVGAGAGANKEPLLLPALCPPNFWPFWTTVPPTPPSYPPPAGPAHPRAGQQQPSHCKPLLC